MEIQEVERTAIAEYARISIAFEVREIAEVTEQPPGSGLFELALRRVESPYIKDYDADGGPETWASRFDLAHWRFFIATENGRRVGGATFVFRAPDMDTLRGREDVALLWDIRVGFHARGHGVGSALVREVARASASQGAVGLEVETQNVNVPACRFYERQGFVLREVNRGAYRTLPDETQLIWYKELRLSS